MKRFLGLAIGVCLLIGFVSSAEATIRINVAEVQNGAAFIQGNATRKSPITWENQFVTTTNGAGKFSFSGVVPADCVGTLSDGVSTINVVVLDCTPVSAAPSPVPQTGQTASYAAGDDGAQQKGVAWPTPRFTDNNNGTITDNLTGLIWLKNANCFGQKMWGQALTDANALADGDCGLTDDSVASDWRLPNINELHSLIDFGTLSPALPAAIRS
jgi:Protein of unknown function (DUF1566)